MKKEYIELYTDYLIASFQKTTATGLSEILDGAISHDKITRFLASKDYTSKELWKLVKKEVREIEKEDGVIIFDDTIVEKQYSKENDLICWHYDHTFNRNIKGINLLNCIYHANGVSLPIAFELVKKPIQFSDLKTRKVKRRSEVTKNEMLRTILKTVQQNQIKWRYLLADSWFSSSENMEYVSKKLKKYFLLALKSNRLVALSMEDKKRGRFNRIDSLNWQENKPIKGWIRGLDFPVLLHRQTFTNKDGSSGFLYLVTNDLNLKTDEMETIYQKRWSVEIFHKNIKSNTALAKSPTFTIRTQSNHVFMSIYAAVKLELLAIKKKMNTFALRAKIYISAIKSAFFQLRELEYA